ncbi:glycosyltransferase family 2 protein [Empedobacter falsenii]
MKPKVSILVPIYGVEKFIERCSISLFEQTFDDLEFIFVNDCTPDNSIEILEKTIEKYPHRKSQVKVINHEINKGLAGARNTGVENAIGDYILHVDSDDYIEKNMVELMCHKAISEDADIVVCDFFTEYHNHKILFKQDIKESNKEFLKAILSVDILSPIWNKLIKINLYKDNQLRAQEGVNLGEDYMIIPKLIYNADRISKVDEPLYYYSQANSDSYTSQKLSKKNIDNVIYVLNDLTVFFKDKPDGYLYEEELLKGKLRKKMDMLFFADKKYIKELNALFPETNDLKDKTFLLSRDKISYPLLKRNYIGLFLLYRNIYKLLFNIKSNLAKK